MRVASPVPVREEWEEWHEGARTGSVRKRGGGIFKPGTLRSYKLSMELRVLPELGPVKLGNVTRFDLQAS